MQSRRNLLYAACDACDEKSGGRLEIVASLTIMNRVALFFLLTIFGGALKAQNYTGTITVGNYTQKGVEAKVQKLPDNTVAVTLFHVRFSSLMPVRLDVVIPTLTLEKGHLSGRDIVPLGDGKRYEKYLVRDFQGTVDATRLSFACLLGKKQLTFNGTRKK